MQCASVKLYVTFQDRFKNKNRRSEKSLTTEDKQDDSTASQTLLKSINTAPVQYT